MPHSSSTQPVLPQCCQRLTLTQLYVFSPPSAASILLQATAYLKDIINDSNSVLDLKVTTSPRLDPSKSSNQSSSQQNRLLGSDVPPQHDDAMSYLLPSPTEVKEATATVNSKEATSTIATVLNNDYQLDDSTIVEETAADPAAPVPHGDPSAPVPRHDDVEVEAITDWYESSPMIKHTGFMLLNQTLRSAAMWLGNFISKKLLSIREKLFIMNNVSVMLTVVMVFLASHYPTECIVHAVFCMLHVMIAMS